MSDFNVPRASGDDSSELRKSLIATAILVALFAVFAVAPPRNPTKVVAGVPCSVLSEDAIGSVLGTRVQLMPTNGTVCQYVSTDSGAQHTLFVVARRDAQPPISVMGEQGTRVNGVGDAAVRMAGLLYVRAGTRWYGFIVEPQTPDHSGAYAEEMRLARLMSRTAIAQNR